MEERVLRIIEEHCGAALDYDGNNMMGDGVIDSFMVLNIVNDLEDEFDIDINAGYVIADNFRNKEAIVALVGMVLSN